MKTKSNFFEPLLGGGIVLLVLLLFFFLKYGIEGLKGGNNSGEFFMGFCTMIGASLVIVAAIIQANGNIEIENLKKITEEKNFKEELEIFTLLTINDGDVFVDSLRSRHTKLFSLSLILEENNSEKEFITDEIIEFIKCPAWMIEKWQYRYTFYHKDILVPVLRDAATIRKEINDLIVLINLARTTSLHKELPSYLNRIIMLYDKQITIYARGFQDLKTLTESDTI